MRIVELAPTNVGYYFQVYSNGNLIGNLGKTKHNSRVVIYPTSDNVTYLDKLSNAAYLITPKLNYNESLLNMN